MQHKEKREYDVRTAAEVIGVSEWTVRRMVADGSIGYYRRGRGYGRIVIRQSDIDNYIAESWLTCAIACAISRG
jgi:excisionase family DNA binding protein